MTDNYHKRPENEKTGYKGLFSSGNPRLRLPLEEKSRNENEFKKTSPSNSSISSSSLIDDAILLHVQKQVIDELDVTLIKGIEDESELRNRIKLLLDYISNRDFPTLSKQEKSIIIQSLIDEFTSLGPLKALIYDDSVTEIMVNGPQQVYVERNGRLEMTKIRFRDAAHVIQQIEKIVTPLGRRIDESSPMVDARLPNGSRINAVIPPLSLNGPVLTIRKFSRIPLSMEKLISANCLTRSMADFLEKAVAAKANIIVSGGTGSGKTTLLNVLSSFIPPGERIITIEDAAELKLLQPHVISLEARPSNTEGKGEITIRDLLRNSLRMRPDRIIVGEVRGVETLDMLQAMNTGHEGSLSTSHSNSPRDTLSRLETMVLYTGIDFPLRAIREQLASAIDLIVYIERLIDGSRKVTFITEVLGLEGDTVVLQDLFQFHKAGKKNGHIIGEFEHCPVRPKLYEKFASVGISTERC